MSDLVERLRALLQEAADAALREEVVPTENARVEPLAMPQLRKLNLGCGTNRLDGWENHDADVDITKRPKRSSRKRKSSTRSSARSSSSSATRG